MWTRNLEWMGNLEFSMTQHLACQFLDISLLYNKITGYYSDEGKESSNLNFKLHVNLENKRKFQVLVS